MIAELTKLVSLILGISIAGDRLVTLIKTIVPNLAAPPATAGAPPADTPASIFKKALLMVIAFLCCWLTAWLATTTMDESTVAALHLNMYSEMLIGLLASGGSAFWTNVLGYLSGLKDLSAQKAAQAKLDNETQKALAPDSVKIKTDALHKAAAVTKTVRFTAAFTEAPGHLSVVITNGPQIDFDADGYKDVDLPSGKVDFTVSGGASPGPKGGAILTIDGVRNSNSPLKYGPGVINVDNQTMSV